MPGLQANNVIQSDKTRRKSAAIKQEIFLKAEYWREPEVGVQCPPHAAPHWEEQGSESKIFRPDPDPGQWKAK